MKRGPKQRYQDLVDNGHLDADAVQATAIDRLQVLSDALESRPSGVSRLFGRTQPPPKGMYLWGGVGRGKSLLMDIFYNNTEIEPKRRLHFHEFMAETHDRIAAWRSSDDKDKRRHRNHNRKSIDDPMPPVAADIASGAKLLCFDELQVTNIADAMILGRLFTAMFSHGVVVVATSNRDPDDLYRDGINRPLFLPAIDTLKTHLDIFELKAERDYRLARLQGAKVYHSPLGADADAAMDQAWEAIICGGHAHREEIAHQGRVIEVPLAARGAARFSFADLCAKPLGARDYLAIARRYGSIFIDRIPRMGPENRNEAIRFITLIDTIYESKSKLICSAEASPDALYQEGDGAFEFARTASRLFEMQSVDYLGAEHGGADPERPEASLAGATASDRDAMGTDVSGKEIDGAH